MLCYAYIRVSGDKQDVEKQEYEVQDYATRNGLLITTTFKIEMSSRRSQKDRNISELTCRMNNGDVLIVPELSRLGRSTVELVTLVDTLIKKGVALHFIKEGMRLNGALDMQGKIMVSLFSLLAELERDRVSQRTKAALKVVKARGVKLGNPNLTDTIRQSGRDKRTQEAKKFAATILPLVKSGLSFQQTANELNAAGVRTRRGKQWTAQAVKNLKKAGSL